MDNFNLNINVGHGGIEINGKKIQLPCHIGSLKKILGEPRVSRFAPMEYGEEDLTDEEVDMLNEDCADNTIYIWDNFGVICYTCDGKNAETISIYLRDSKLEERADIYPQQNFGGRLTIFDEPWVNALESGEEFEDSKSIVLGDYSVYGFYADMEQHLFEKETKYFMIDITLCEDMYS